MHELANRTQVFEAGASTHQNPEMGALRMLIRVGLNHGKRLVECLRLGAFFSEDHLLINDCQPSTMVVGFAHSAERADL
ncbi:hypothetical protein D3C76_907420 [compost metagenome]